MSTPPSDRRPTPPVVPRLLRQARAHGGAVGKPDPARSDGAVHGRRHGAVQAVLRRRRGASVQAGGQLAEVRPRRWQAQRPRRRRSHQAPSRVLRDARQLQLRRLLQARDHPVELGARVDRGGSGFDGDRLWITVHESDDEAEAIWHEQVGVPMERIQRLGDKDNFWQMGDTGPCGPCSEIHIDRGPAFGPDGGPLDDPARRPLHGVLEPGVHAVQPGARRQPHAAAASRRSTPVPVSSGSSPCCRASTRCGRPTSCCR